MHANALPARALAYLVHAIELVGDDHAQRLDAFGHGAVAEDRFGVAGLRLERYDGRAFHCWLLPRFNPRPRLARLRPRRAAPAGSGWVPSPQN